MKMTKYEHFAANQFLSEYPAGKTFEELMQLVLDYDDSVVIWEPFEDHLLSTVVEWISDLAMESKRVFEEPHENR